MTIAISASRERFDSFCSLFPEQSFVFISEENTGAEADAVFVLDHKYDIMDQFSTKPVFVHDVLKNINTSEHVFRINLWPGFEANAGWEICGEISEPAEAVLTTLQKKIISAPDIPGLISARVIAMIINEAFFAIEDNVSTAAEIDTAMKLGTNYPYGPMEWAAKIGYQEIYNLLLLLSETNPKYKPANMLIEKAERK